MILTDCLIPVNDRSQELKPHGNAAFPCAGYAIHYQKGQEENVAWHWHDELEIIYIAGGQMTAKVPAHTFRLTAGDILAVNGNTLHAALADPECDLQSFVFSPSLISGSDDSILWVKYIRPLLTSPSGKNCHRSVSFCTTNSAPTEMPLRKCQVLTKNGSKRC